LPATDCVAAVAVAALARRALVRRRTQVPVRPLEFAGGAVAKRVGRAAGVRRAGLLTRRGSADAGRAVGGGEGRASLTGAGTRRGVDAHGGALAARYATGEASGTRIVVGAR